MWKTNEISDKPEIILIKWQVYEVTSSLWNGTTRHFVGYNIRMREGRVSTSIIELDPVILRAKTKSGRVYQLMGESAPNRDGLYTFDVWCRVNCVNLVKNVTEELVV